MIYKTILLSIAFGLMVSCTQKEPKSVPPETNTVSVEVAQKSSELQDIVVKLPEFKWIFPYKLPELDFGYSELEPIIDEVTMKTHHGKHHNGYTMKTNKALENKSYKSVPIVKLFAKIDQHPKNVRNNGGGFYNHALFWTFLTPGGSNIPDGLKSAIENYFKSFDQFKSTFETAALSQFGSGWAWLVMTPGGELKVSHTLNQDNPLMPVSEIVGIPLLNLDVWEHAYYLNYKNKRGEYISKFWEIVNWETVYNRYKMAKEIVGN